MKKNILGALRMLVTMTLLCGVAYPMAVTGLARWCFTDQAKGSLLRVEGRFSGSRLLAQAFTNEAYFHPRPSAANFGTTPSGASNQGGTSASLKQAMEDRQAYWGGQAVPMELLQASGSGLDPHLSPAAAQFQLERVARARGFNRQQQDAVALLIERHTEPPQLGFLGEPRVNVLLLNCALNEYASQRHE